MSRQLFALALLIGGIIVAIVRGQENEPGYIAESVESEATDIWADVEQADTVAAAGELSQEAGSSRYSVAPAAATEEGDGMRSVLKRSATGRSTLTDEIPTGGYSSRRSTAIGRRSDADGFGENAADDSEPAILTARNPNARRSAGGTRVLASEGLQLISVAPTLSVEATGPQAITVGKSATYRIVLANGGTEMANDVVVSLAIPASVTVDGINASAGEGLRSEDGGITWSLPAIAGGSREQLELQLTPREDRPITLGLNWTMRAAPTAATIEVQKPALAVQISGPDEIVYGAQQIYTITISNPGTGPAENVSLEVATGGGKKAKPLGTIAPGAQEQIRMELIARESGMLQIRATASAEGLHEEANKEIVVRRAELAVEMTGPAFKFAGTSGEYQIHVRNEGTAAASNVQLALRLPPGVRYAGGLDQAVEAAGLYTLALGELGIDQSQHFTVTVQYEAAGTHVCEISASAEGDLGAAAECETQIEAVADLAMSVSDPPGPSAVGADVTYEIRVTNRGSKAAESINVVGQFAAGIEPVRADGHAAEVVTGQVIFKPIPRVEAGETLVLKIVARADKSGNHRFRAVLKCDDPETELVAEDTTQFFGDGSRAAGRKSGTQR